MYFHYGRTESEYLKGRNKILGECIDKIGPIRREVDDGLFSSVPLHCISTDFQREIWEILCTIPYEKTITYGEIAGQIAAKRGEKWMSALAVGGAVGHNKISLIIPCHRVVGSDGSLTGYAGGLERKAGLLALEGVGRKNGLSPEKEDSCDETGKYRKDSPFF